MTMRELPGALAGRILFLAPHQDDEILGCGGLIALLPEKHRLHFAFATDGASFPQPLTPQQGARDPKLSGIREAESRAALGGLGVPQDNILFMGFPDSQLRRRLPAVAAAIGGLLERIQPQVVYAPFEYDRQPDHIALHDAALRAIRQAGGSQPLVEYMVYFRWPLMGGDDIRRSLCPEQLVTVDIQRVLADKRRALECFASQFTRFYPWQERAGVAQSMIDESFAATEETFVVRRQGRPLLVRNRARIKVCHLLQRYLEEPVTLQKKRLQAKIRAVWPIRAA